MLSLGSTTSKTPPQQIPTGSKKFSAGPCYTCRRRRVTCDRLLPTCQKCDKAQKACLGYTKPITWVRGIASRGKMMGLTFGNVTAKKPSPGYPVHGVVPPAGNEPADSVSSGGLGSVQASLGLPCNIGCFSSWSSPLDVSNVVEECPRSGVAFPEWNSSGRCNESEREFNPSIPLTLIDPLFQGLDKISRHYLTYCKYRPLS